MKFSLFNSIAHIGFVLAACAGFLSAEAANNNSMALPGAGANDAAIELAANRLLSQMSTDEKVGQLSQLFYIPALFHLPGLSPEKPAEESIALGKVGSLTFVTDPKTANRLQHIAVDKTPHHIPLIFGNDVVHGFRTIFPVPLAMAASWDPELVSRSQAIAAMEARAAGVNWTFSPMVDVARDARWGRIVEGAGEDPYLGSVMAAAQVRGFQGDHIGAPSHLLACAKHFAGYGAAEGGRDYDAAYIPEELLRNVYLPPFHAAVDAGVGTLMSAYLDVNDVPATGNRWLLHDILRAAWGFKGFVVSDADAVKSLSTHGFARDEQDAAVRALRAGVNMEMAGGHDAYADELPAAMREGLVTQAQLDDAVRPILKMKFRLGLFDHPFVDETLASQILADPAHRDAARVAAERSAVLLRNKDNLLPLNKGAYHRIAVIGPLADSKIDTTGPDSFQQKASETVTVLDGLRATLGSDTALTYAQGAQLRRRFTTKLDALSGAHQQPEWSEEQTQQEIAKAVDAARGADLAVMVLGEAQNMTGESASRGSLDLPGAQERLLEAVSAIGKPIVLILINGRPLNIVWASQHVPAILEAWYPGSQGGNAIAHLLFGDATPGGKLPLTWPRNVGQIPIGYAHNTTQAPESQGERYWDEESTPLYPFGFGLSYASFNLTNLHIDRDAATLAGAVNVSVDVKNTGTVTGDEVVQLYTHQRYGSASRPVRELKGFRRVTLIPGQTETIRFPLGREQLSYWSGASHTWIYEPSTYDFWVGDDSAASQHMEFSVTN